MKNKTFSVSTFLLTVFLGTMVSFSCQMCLAESFDMTASPSVLLLCALGAAIFCAGLFRLRRAGLLTLLLLAVSLAVILYFRAPLWEALLGAVYCVTKVYAKAFPAIQTMGIPQTDATVPLILAGLPLTWFTARTVCREGSVLLVVLACLPVLILCLIIVDIAPAFWLILLTAALLILLISQSVRDRSSAEGSRLAWWLVLPTVILIAGITILWPPATYQRSDYSLLLQEFAETKLPFETPASSAAAVIHRWNPSLKKVNLAAVGPRFNTGLPALTYETDREISLLRGVSLGVYENNTWSAIPEDSYRELSLTLEPLTMTGWAMEDPTYTVSVTTVTEHINLLTPYGMLTLPEGSPAIDDAYVQNADRLISYSISFRDSDRMTWASGLQMSRYEDFVHLFYTQIPSQLQTPLREIADEAGLTGLSSAELPQAVAAFVRSAGTYDLSTPRIPAGEDFVLYFLQESRQGYCVHFATAAAMLLRSLDVPARYVTGYSVSGPAGIRNTVTEDDAHAWVEYYADGIGWLPLDPTPAAPDGNTPEPAPGSPQEQPPAQTQPDLPEQTPQPPTADQTPDDSHDPSAPGTPAVRPKTALSPALLWLLIPIGIPGLILLRRMLVLRHRKKQCTTGHPNRQALRLWRQLLALSRASGAAVTEELLCLAEKAKFSQHILRNEELQLLRQACDDRIRLLQTHPLYKRLWYRFGSILY